MTTINETPQFTEYAMSTPGGNEAKNQTWAKADNGAEMFISYGTLIAYRDAEGQVLLNRDYWNHSATTGRYRNKFLYEGIAETRAKIEAGEYTLADL